MKAMATGGGDYAQPPMGQTLQARCYKLVDVSTQRSDFEGKVSLRRQIIIGFELPNDLMDDGRPFTVSAFFTLSLNEKAKLRGFLEGWRGRTFSEQELQGFDMKVLLGKPCYLGIIDKNGKARIGAAMSQPRQVECPPQVNANVYFSLEPGEFDRAVFDSLSESIQRIIRLSPEWAELQNPTAGKSASVDDDDSIPFSIPMRLAMREANAASRTGNFRRIARTLRVGNWWRAAWTKARSCVS